jgi:uncharacterized phage protein gp47/JayE
MKPTVPTTQEIKDNIISNIEQNINQETPLLLKAFNRVIATALAGMISLMYKFGTWILKQAFTTTRDLENLLVEGNELNIPIKKANATQLTITIIGNEGATLLAGVNYYNPITSYVYSLMSDVTIPTGQTSVIGTIESLTVGTQVNIPVGTILSLVTPDDNFDNNVTVLTVEILGVDSEETEDYRNRILQAKKNIPQGGAISDYVKWSLEVLEITRAFVFRTSPGIIFIYALTDNLTSRIPTAEKILELQDYLRDESRKPLNDDVYVGEFQEINFDITITGLYPNTVDVKNLITENITSFLLDREPKQYNSQTIIKNIISKANLVSIATNSGAIIFDLTFEITGTGISLESYTLANNEVCKLNNINIS